MIQNADFLGKGWSFPLQVEGGAMAMNEGLVNIQQSIRIILSTRKGERIMEPDFGCAINTLVFSPNQESTRDLASFYVRDALEEWEPRISVDEVRVEINSHDRARLDIHVTYTVLKANQSENLVYPFYLENP